MMRAPTLALVSVLLVVSVVTAGYTQTPTSTLSGTVVDSSGAVIPGATVLVKNTATSTQFEAVTGAEGTFSVPALDAGVYSVTISLSGFKQVVLPNVQVNAAIPATVRVTLEVGNMAETVVVQGGSEILQTQSTAISTTMDVNQLSNLPLTTRNALDFVTFLPGVNTPGTLRGSTINGLPQSSINITLDGANINDNHNRTTDGFFALITPVLDAVEEVSVSTATPGAEAAGQGAVQIRFVTRSGTNEMRGSAYNYVRHHKLNTNYYFNARDNLAKDPVELYQFGGRLGGPLTIPGVMNGRDRLFYFANFEEFRQPNAIARFRTILNPLAQQGIFQYNTAQGVRSVDLFALARANGQVSTPDPIVARLLDDIRASTSQGTLTALTNPNHERFSFTNTGDNIRHLPTVRFDYNLSQRHRLTFSSSYQIHSRSPDTLNADDPAFPGFPNFGSQQSDRLTWSSSGRSTLTRNLVNEVRAGYTSSRVDFQPEISAATFSGPVANQGGFSLGISAAGITNAHIGTGNNSRQTPTFQLEDTLNWVRGKHSISMGGAFTQVNLYTEAQTSVPAITFGVDANDPAVGLFTAGNFQGASNTNLTDARNLYAVLTGRVTQVGANAILNENTLEYSHLGQRIERGRIREFGFFVQDSWRLRPDLTVNAGLRYELQLPFTALNSTYTYGTVEDVFGISGPYNMFNPGSLRGKTTELAQFAEGDRPFDVDYNNFAPNLGFAWTPTLEKGWLRTMLGADGDTVFRGGYALAYNRYGIADFAGVFNGNPGASITANRNNALGNLVAPGTSLPVLLRETNRLGPPPFPATPSYPLTRANGAVQITNSITIFDPNLQTPYAQSWTFGVQRALSKNMAVEVRYVGTRHLQGLTEYNYNEANIVENRFLDEFRLAQRNLEANIAAGRGANFRYFGEGTNTFPLPIYLAYFAGLPQSQATNPANYTSASFASTDFTNALARFNPNPFTPAGTNVNTGLEGSQTRRDNALRAGLAPNFFRVNPDLQGGASIHLNGGYTRYDSLQVDFRRRLTQGLFVQANYVYGKAYVSSRLSFRTPRLKLLDTGAEGNVDHAFKANWTYELPFGNGRRFAGGATGLKNYLIGGWAIDGTARVQTGRNLTFGNLRMVGFDRDELQKVFKIRIDPQTKFVYMLPQDIIDNTIKAFSVSATSATGYGALGPPEGRYFAPANGPDCIEIVPGFGDCGSQNIYVRGPMFSRIDISVLKKIPLKGKLDFEFRAEFLNAFDAINFIPVAFIPAAGDINTFSQVGSSYRDPNNNQDPGGRLVQIVTRISW